MDFIKKWFKKINIRSPKIIFIVGVAGLVLIALSSLLDQNEQKSISSTVTYDATTEYIDTTEERLTKIVEGIVHGDAQVMVTLESGVEYIYANEIKTDVGLTEDKNGEENTKTQQNDSNQKSYVTVKDAQGNEEPLIITQVMPAIRGVVVVCNGGENPSIAAAVKSAVITALNISEKKVCVLGKN